MAPLAVVLLLDLALAGCLQSGWRPGSVSGLPNVVSGFAVGQVCLAAVWIAFLRQPSWASWLMSAVVLVAASWLREQLGFFLEFTLLDYVCRNLLQALVPLVVLWLLVRTPAWRAISRESDRNAARLVYSVRRLLFWMTLIALLAVLMGRATQLNGRPLAMTQWMGLIAPGLVAVSNVLIRQIPIPLALRLLPHLAVGVVIGYALAELAQNSLHKLLAIEFGTQAIVIALGVELGRVTRPLADAPEPPTLDGTAQQENDITTSIG